MSLAAEKEPMGDWPPPVEVLNASSPSPLVLICDHASNHIPRRYNRLGLQAADLERHIAYDIGAGEVTRRLGRLLGAPAFLGTYSRLLIDLNRPFGSATSIPVLSEATAIPGNRDLSTDERALRRARVFDPFHAAISDLLDRRGDMTSLIVAIHSFTPVFLGVARHCHVGILHEDAPTLAREFLSSLAVDDGLIVAENEPYSIERDGDYAIPIHGTDRGNPAVLIEIRHDLIDCAAGIEHWVNRLALILTRLTAQQQPAGRSRQQGVDDARH